MSKDKKKVLIILGVVLGLVGVITLSYAFLSVGGKQSLANTFTSGCLSITIENESNAISLNGAYPITDVEGLSTEGYNFTIKNTCSTSENYIINLENIDRQANSLSSDYLKISLNSDTFDNIITKLSSNEVTTPTISNAYEAYTIYKGKIEGNTTKTFKLREWLDYDATKEQAANKVIKNKINVIAKSDIETEELLGIKTSNSGNSVIGNTILSLKEPERMKFNQSEQVVNDETYPFSYNEETGEYTSTNKGNAKGNMAVLYFLADKDYDNINICYNLSSLEGYGEFVALVGLITKIYTSGVEENKCVSLGSISKDGMLAVEYISQLPDGMENPYKDEVTFYFEAQEIDTKVNSVKFCSTSTNMCEPYADAPSYIDDNSFYLSVAEDKISKVVSTALGNIEVNERTSMACYNLDGGKIYCTEPIESAPNFNGLGVNNEGLYEAKDNDGISYYYRGAVENNYVKFGKWSEDTPDVYCGYYSSTSAKYKEYSSLEACQSASSYNVNCTKTSKAGKDMYWRIIRINGDGTIRMIYDGTGAHANGTDTKDSIALNAKWSHKDAYYNSAADNAYTNDNAYVGFQYTLGELHGLSTKSNALEELEKWYENNLLSYANNIDKNTGFCGDRAVFSGSGIGTANTSYSTSKRFLDYYPTLKCSNEYDLYTASEANKGSKSLKYPIGLITIDEIQMAGGMDSFNNRSYYLYNGQNYWSMSPDNFDEGKARMYYVIGDGFPSYASVYASNGLRPVINLRADTKFTYNSETTKGTMNDPYIVT